MKKTFLAVILVIMFAVAFALPGCADVAGDKSFESGNTSSDSGQSDNVMVEHFSVTYFAGSSAAKGVAPVQDDIEKGKAFVVAENTFSVEGYRFTYWTDSNGVAYEPGEVMVVHGDVKLTANWAANEFTAYADETQHYYDGQQHKPPVTVVYGIELLDEDDYTVDYGEGNYIDVGEYTITINGNGNYAGLSATITFSILKAQPIINVFDQQIKFGENIAQDLYEIVGVADKSGITVNLYKGEAVLGEVGLWYIEAEVVYSGEALSNFAPAAINRGTVLVEYESLRISQVNLAINLISGSQAVNLSYTLDTGSYENVILESDSDAISISGKTITAEKEGVASVFVRSYGVEIAVITVRVVDYEGYTPISTVEEFFSMDLEGKYVQINDIDFAGAEIVGVNIGGVYDGGGYALKNFATKNVFARVDGTVRNVQFIGKIIGDGVMGAAVVGNNYGTIENVYADIDLDIPTATDGWSNISAGTIIHWNHDAFLRNAVIHVTATKTAAGTSYPGAVLDNMDIAPYWNSDHINNVYIYLDNAEGVSAATPQVYSGGWDAVDKWNTTIHAYRNYADFIVGVHGAFGNAFDEYIDASNVMTVNNSAIEVGQSIDLASLVDFRLTPTETTFAITSGNSYATLSGTMLRGIAAGSVNITVTAGYKKENLIVNVQRYLFNYNDSSVTLVVKSDGVNNYGSFTYHEYSASTYNLSLFTFESSDTFVATVSSDGTITAVGDGTATINVKLDGSIISSIEVTVDVWSVIKTPEQFLAMTDGKYALVQDIDFSGAAAGLLTFSGTLDGNGYALKNFATKNLIANNNGIIRNVQIIGSIVGDGVMGAAIIGNNRGTIENVYAEIDMNIPAATDGWNDISAGTIIHWSHETGLVKNVVVHVTATQTAAATLYPGAVLDFMGASPYWDTNHINNVYIYLDDAAGVTAATPNNGQGNVPVDILNPTVHAFRNSPDYMDYVSAAISSDSLPSAIFQIVDGKISLIKSN